MKLRYFAYAIVLILLLLIQSTWIASLVQWGSQPALYLLFLLWIGYHEGRQPAQIIGFVTGLAMDLVLGTPLGLSAFVFTLLGFLAGSAKGKVVFDTIFYPIVLGALVVVYKNAMYAILMSLFQILSSPRHSTGGHWALELALTCLSAPVFFSLANLLRRRFVRTYGGFQGG